MLQAITNAQTSLNAVNGRANFQQWVFGSLYGVGILATIVLPGAILGSLLKPVLDRTLPDFPRYIFHFPALIITSIWVVGLWKRGTRDIKGSQVGFKETWGAPRRVAPPGRAFCLVPIERIGKTLVWIEQREVSAEDEIDIKEVPDRPATAGQPARAGHPRSAVIMTLGLVVKVTDPYKYAYVLQPGGSLEDKQKVYGGTIMDRTQTFVNRDGHELSEDDVVALVGDDIFEGVRDIQRNGQTLVQKMDEWGIELLQVIIRKVDFPPEIKKSREEGYKQEMEGKASQVKMSAMAKWRFGKNIDGLTEEERRELQVLFLTKESIDSIKPTDKTIFGAAGSVKKRISEEMIAEGIVAEED